MKIQFKGIGKWMKYVENCNNSTTRQVEKVIQDTGKAIVRDAKAVVPVDTGKLKRSIRVVSTSKLRVTVEAQANHASYVEYGTYKMAARPYMTPAVIRNKAVMDKKLKQIMAKVSKGGK